MSPNAKKIYEGLVTEWESIKNEQYVQDCLNESLPNSGIEIDWAKFNGEEFDTVVSRTIHECDALFAD